MKRNLSTLILFLITGFSIQGTAQILPSTRSTDWMIAGLKNKIEQPIKVYKVESFGFVGDSITPNDSALSGILKTISDSGAVILFPSGCYLFNHSIKLPNNTILRGAGASRTLIHTNAGSNAHSFHIEGETKFQDTSSFAQGTSRNDKLIHVLNGANFQDGDWIQVLQTDSDLVTSNWARETVGQIVKITSKNNNQIGLESPLRMDFDLNRRPFIRKLIPIENIGIECIKIERLDNSAPNQISNIYYMNAVNCWVKGVESNMTTFAHIEATASSNIYIHNSYFHHAFDYGTGGRAYGVLLDSTTNECLVENNVFEHLRHSMLVQAGANGNVFAYNYSFDPFWSSTPNNSAGDMVLHGNYPYLNLFEQNICQNIVIDDSHGPNGKYNTFFRNRAEGFGVFFSAANSPYQNIIGNEIPNTGFPFNLVNYTIGGTNHFLHGNNNKGTIDPAGTANLADSSYAYKTKPEFLNKNQWHGIGVPSVMSSSDVPAKVRVENNNFITSKCITTHEEEKPDGSAKKEISTEKVTIFPNPTNGSFTIKGTLISLITIQDITGRLVSKIETNESNIHIDLIDHKAGIYFVDIIQNGKSIVTKIVVR